MKDTLLGWIYVTAFYCGIVKLCYWLNRRRQVVVTYHNVLPDGLFDDSLHLGMSHAVSAFERQIQIIAKRWPSPHADGCLITFDDGYANQGDIAAPILERYGRRAIFFVTLDLVINGKMLWPDRFLMWLSYVPDGVYQLLDQPVVIDGADSRRRCWSWIWEQLSANYGRLGKIDSDLAAAFPFDHLPIDEPLKASRFAAMTQRQIGDLARRGHRIGCHSYYHHILAHLSDQALRDDFRQCESGLGDVFNCDLYSYPFGGPAEVTEREQKACQTSRFRQAYVNVPSMTPNNADGAYAMPRMSLPNTSNRYVIEAKLSGFEGFLKKVVAGAAG